MQQSGKQPQIPDRLRDYKSQTSTSTHKDALSQKKSLMKEGNGVGERVKANEIFLLKCRGEIFVTPFYK